MSIQVTTLSNPILSIDRRRNNRALQSSAFAVLRVHLGAGDLLPHLKGLLASGSHSSVVYLGGIARGVVGSDCPLREIVQRDCPAAERGAGDVPPSGPAASHCRTGSIRSFGVLAYSSASRSRSTVRYNRPRPVSATGTGLASDEEPARSAQTLVF